MDDLLAGLCQPVQYKKACLGANLSRPQGTWFGAGEPGPASSSIAGVGGETLSSTGSQPAGVPGQIPFFDPDGGKNAYLAKWTMGSGPATGGYAILVDRLWQNSGLSATLTTAQTVNSVAWPARDNNGSTNGEGVFLG